VTDTGIVTLPGTSNEYSLTRFMPRDLTELVRFSEYAAKSGVFGTLTPGQALIIMLQGAEFGINPLQALREIPLVNGKPYPSATLVAGLIQRSPVCEDWHIESSPTSCTIHAKRRGRGSEFVVNIRIEDVPASLRSKQVWKDNPEDMLVARAIHRIARRAFADILAGIQDADEIDETRVIDVAKVERETADVEHPCPNCDAPMFLHGGRAGGAFLRCHSCGETAEPPQEVRDLIRGTPERLTLAAGEREPTAEEQTEFDPAPEESAVQSDSPGDTMDERGQDPASAAAPIPEPDAPLEIEEIRATNHLDQWRSHARDAIAQFVRGRRNAATDEEKALIRESMIANGWDQAMGITSYLRGCDDVELSRLIDAFELHVSILHPPAEEPA
jgi:hypothetical protein